MTKLIQIKDEWRLSSQSMSKIVTAILNVKLDGGKSIRDKFDSKYRPVFEKKLLAFFSEYEGYINRVCNERRYYLRDEVKDCKQFVYMNLYKAYEKRYSYTNWDRVVRAIIKRKIIDFSKSVNSDTKKLVNETDFIASANTEEDIKLQETGLYKDDTFVKMLNCSFEINEVLYKLKKFIDEDGRFTENDELIISSIINSYENGVMDIDKILQGTGLNKSERAFAFKVFTSKISRYINIKSFR